MLALAEVVQYLVEEIAEGGVAAAIFYDFSAAIFYDFSAAFNSGRRSDMIDEFRRPNILEKEVTMLEQFLSERELKIKCGGVASEGVAIHGGVTPRQLPGRYVLYTKLQQVRKA